MYHTTSILVYSNYLPVLIWPFTATHLSLRATTLIPIIAKGPSMGG